MMTSRAAHGLSRLQRAALYGIAGVTTEVVFTALDALRRGGPGAGHRLEGHSYLWMLPIYGLSAALFEPVHHRLRERPAWQRAAAYSAGIMTVEYMSGRTLRRVVGVIPWDYSAAGRLVIGGGATRLDYAPLWAIAGLGLERIHEALLRVRIETPASTVLSTA